MKNCLFYFLFLFLIFTMTHYAIASTYTVDDDGTADFILIQDAINTATSGDTVYVYPGTYNEQIILKNGVRLIGNGPENTIIDGGGSYNQVVIYSGTTGTEISGFRITGSSGYNYWTTCGIYCRNGPITITNNVITGNYCGISIYNGKPTIINNTITGNVTGICAGPCFNVKFPPGPCYPKLPDPELTVYDAEDIPGGTYIRLRLRVTNWYQFPDDLFTPAPLLPPCGLNPDSSRTWVHIYDQDDVRLYGFCALPSADYLYNSLWVAVPRTNIPEKIYIVLEDRECRIKYVSNYVSPESRPSDYTIMNNIISNNSNIGLFFYHYAGAGRILYNDVWGNTAGNYFNNLDGSSFSPWPGTGEISADPEYADADFHLLETSPCIDAGHPGSLYNDMDGTRNDMGAYGGINVFNGPSEHSGNGFLFTSIGKIPLSEIVQDDTDPEFGLANVDPVLASEYGIAAYRNSPFGGKLWIHGLFGDSPPDTDVKYYQIYVGKWNGSTPPDSNDFIPLDDPLTKVKYTINPDGSVYHEKVSLGPKSVDGYDNLYELTRTGYWSHIDLRMIWNTTSWDNGKYTLTYIAYEEFPVVHPVTLFDNALDEITIIIDNSPVEVEILEVQYDSGITIPECSIIELTYPEENLRFFVKAWHPNGYLGGYSLKSYYGRNRYSGIIGSDTYAGVHDATPYWNGELNKEYNSIDAMTAGILKPWITCAYRFRLHAWSRTTDGFHYIRGAEFNDHYYIEVQPCIGCGKR